MLREGWDVQNVTVIVGLRPYTSKANILPEQTIGRGLRLMFGGMGTSYTERVDIIGNPAFLKFVEQLERDEDITLDTFDLKDPLVIKTIAPDPLKLARDITIPVLSPILARKKTLAEEIAGLDVQSFTCPVFPRKPNDKAAQSFTYEGKDIVTLEKIVEREYKVPEPRRRGGHLLLRQAHRSGRQAAESVRGPGAEDPGVPRDPCLRGAGGHQPA